MKTDELELQLHAVLGRPLTADRRNWLDERVATMVAQPRVARRSLRLARSAALAIALSLVLATVFGVWAGQQSTEAPHGMQSAAAYEAERNAAIADTPIPPGATWPASLSEPADSSARYGLDAGLSEVEYTAGCLWLGHWLDQHENGSRASRAAALAGILQMRTWRTFGDPTINRSIDYFEGLFAAAQRGEGGPIRAQLAANCGG